MSGGAFERIAAAGIPITTFSAAEILAGDIRFMTDASSAVPAFEVSATDTVHTTAFIRATVTLAATVDPALLAAAGAPSAPTVVATSSQAVPGAGSTAAGAVRAIESPEQVEASIAERPPVPMAIPRSVPARSARTAGDPAPGESETSRPAPTSPEGTQLMGAPVGGTPPTAVLVPPPAGSMTPLAALPAVVPARAPGLFDAANLTMDRNDLAAAQSALGNAEWREALEKAKAATVAQGRLDALVVGSSTAVAGSLTVGYVMWLVRGGVLLSSLMSSLPAWRVLDPLPILGRTRDDGDEPDGEGPEDPLERLFVRARSALGRVAEAPSPDSEPRK